MQQIMARVRVLAELGGHPARPLPHGIDGSAAIIHAEAKEDGSVELSMANGIDLPLTADDAEMLEQILTQGVQQAQTMAARQAAQNLGLVQIPGKPH